VAVAAAKHASVSPLFAPGDESRKPARAGALACAGAGAIGVGGSADERVGKAIVPRDAEREIGYTERR
jgi:hypothetical protein